MMEMISELIIYKNFEHGGILNDMTFIMENYSNEYYNLSDIKALLYDQLNGLVELAEKFGFEGNLWHNYLAFLLANNENAYSTSCEIIGEVQGSINEMAKNDFKIFIKLFQYDFEKLIQELNVPTLSFLLKYKSTDFSGKVYNKRIKERICELSNGLSNSVNEEEFKKVITSFYKDFGVGKLGLNKAFRIEASDSVARLVPITNICHVHLDDLVGYELQKKKLVDNTEAFVKGKKANNCLLFGDAGTGNQLALRRF